jgi:hypothetical protein
MTRIRFRTHVLLEHLNPVSDQFTRDGLTRIIEMVFNYLSVKRTVTIEWVGTTKEVDHRTSAITDL